MTLTIAETQATDVGFYSCSVTYTYLTTTITRKLLVVIQSENPPTSEVVSGTCPDLGYMIFYRDNTNMLASADI